VGISIGKDSSSHEPIRRAGGWAVSLLAGSQAGVAQHFARSGIPPVALWVGVDVRDGPRGPLVQGALGWLECRTTSEHEAGDHTVFIGEVESIELGTAGEGLVYRGGGFHPG
jgi:flavin reductase (DIM6/NTAB) family NADH-FMN oxidoreductase RutF